MGKRKITIIGGGAVGGIIGAYLVKAGLNVTVVDQWVEHVEAMRKGLIVDGCRGEFKTPLHAVLPAELEGPLDVVFLATKLGQTLKSLEAVVPLLEANSVVVTLQNGINEDIIAEMIGPQRTMGCVVGWGATSVKPGHLTQTSQGVFVLGSLAPEGGDIYEIQGILTHINECFITANIYGIRWLKLLGNCCIATGTLLGRTIGETVSLIEVQPIIEAIIYEGLAVAAKKGVYVETLNQKFSPSEYIKLKEFIARGIIELLKTEHRNILPAFYQDILKGRKSEIDFINGYIVSKGVELGVPTPVNSAVVKMIHQIEEGRRRFGMENIYQLGRP